MMIKIRQTLKSKTGFTLVETMMTMLILSMAASVIAGGMPAAVTAYSRVVDSSNAQALLSTTMIRLRDELGTASDITFEPDTDPKRITYTCADGSQSYVFCRDTGTEPGVFIQEYANIAEASEVKKYEHLLVSDEASNKNLYVTYDDFTADTYRDGVITFKNLEVKTKPDSSGASVALASVETYEIRVLTWLPS